jgi:hypothetical protein
MRSISTRVARGAAVATLLALLAVPAVFADDQNPFDPPAAKIGPPIGATSFADQNPSDPPAAKIRPPIGATSLTPIRDVLHTVNALFFMWCEGRIGVPIR